MIWVFTLTRIVLYHRLKTKKEARSSCGGSHGFPIIKACGMDVHQLVNPDDNE